MQKHMWQEKTSKMLSRMWLYAISQFLELVAVALPPQYAQVTWV